MESKGRLRTTSFFSADPRVNKLWLEVIGSDYLMINRMSRILYNNRFYQYPLNFADVITKLGVIESLLCFISYMRDTSIAKGSKNIEQTFESWVVSKFGRRLFEKFFKTYSEKLWGIPCNQLDVDYRDIEF